MRLRLYNIVTHILSPVPRIHVRVFSTLSASRLPWGPGDAEDGAAVAQVRNIHFTCYPGLGFLWGVLFPWVAALPLLYQSDALN